MKQGTFSGSICGNVVRWNDGECVRTGETAVYVKGNCGAQVTVATDNTVAVTKVLKSNMDWEVTGVKTEEHA